MGTFRVLVCGIDDRENGHGRNPEIESLAAFADQIFHVAPFHAGHRGNGLVVISTMHKKRINEIRHIEPRFTGHPPQAFTGPVTAQAGGQLHDSILKGNGARTRAWPVWPASPRRAV